MVEKWQVEYYSNIDYFIMILVLVGVVAFLFLWYYGYVETPFDSLKSNVDPTINNRRTES